ncbi:protocatechuate 3,4-dioxygenase subunit alpha [Paralcaligenes sp. KSB-10]|uniref:protocatechuate 3,4-dioxygenase subunit alpha n=1 Tax=Paralcaligenes sp. KSB-10 TaxID=2901142 RepID=UPI001E54BFC6|nr:protocatechuate 3,4-dioxygenase subunit alpha [Paralcaligenes sp. KSB-10]UHL66024.1 protocatechuate 3,4-dioxygenase subunit alpha [Paralcaligenes sp. KSB-10]
MKLKQTPSQTVGPFFAYGLTPKQYSYDFPNAFTPDIAGDQARGEHIMLAGRVFDGAGKVVNDALLEIFQADADGRYAESAAQIGASGFTGFGRVGTGTDPDSRYIVQTVKPGATDGAAPHVDVILTMRGMLNHLFTRIYFDDETAANAEDPVLQSVPAERRNTLLARRQVLDGRVIYHFDFYMQGAQETVFFDL